MSTNRPNDGASTIKEVTVPYRPPKIDKADLKAGGGFLVSPAEVEKIKQLIAEEKLKINNGIRLTKSDLKRLSPSIESSYSIAILPKEDGYQIVAIYVGKKETDDGEVIDKTLGSGSFGKVKLGQDLETGKFVAVKIQRCVLPTTRKKQDAEIRMLKRLGLATGSFIYEPTGQNKKAYSQRIIVGKDENNVDIVETQTKANLFVMDLASGKSLSSQIDDLSMSDRNLIALGMIELLDSLHQKGALHLDIKLENFMYDKESRTLTMIDYGESLDLDPDKKTAEASLRCSPFTAPPEIKTVYDNREDLSKVQSEAVVSLVPGALNQTILRYTEATDIYSMGIALGQLYGLVEMPKYSGVGFLHPATITNNQSTLFQTNSIIPDEKQRAEMLSFLHHVTANAPSDRASLTETKKYFEGFSKHFDLPENRSKVAIVNLEEYDQQTAGGKFYIEEALKQFNEVILVYPQKDIDSQRALSDRMEFVSTLKDDGVSVRQHVLYGDSDCVNLISQVPAYENKNPVTPSSDYVFITTQKLDAEQTKTISGQVKPVSLVVNPNFSYDNPLEADRLDIKEQVVKQLQNRSRARTQSGSMRLFDHPKVPVDASPKKVEQEKTGPGFTKHE